MSLKEIVPLALEMANEDEEITEEVPPSKITFARGIQGVSKPYMILSIEAVNYDSTTETEDAVASYRIDYHTYADTAQKALTIHEKVVIKAKEYALHDYDVRLFDEDYFVDVDGVHRSTVSVVFRSNITHC